MPLQPVEKDGSLSDNEEAGMPAVSILTTSFSKSVNVRDHFKVALKNKSFTEEDQKGWKQESHL